MPHPGGVFSAVSGPHLTVSGEPLQLLRQDSDRKKSRLRVGSQTAAFRMSPREEKLEARDSGRVPGEQSLGQKGKASKVGSAETHL